MVTTQLKNCYYNYKGLKRNNLNLGLEKGDLASFCISSPQH